MSFATEVVKRQTKGITCLEIVLDNQTLYLADTSFQEADKHWQPRILNKPVIKRSVDPENRRFSISEVSVELSNNTDDAEEEGYFEDLLVQETFDNRAANIYLKYVEDDGTVVSQKIHSGVCEPKGLSADGLKFTLIIKNNLQAKMPILQRVINTVAFPNAPEGDVATKPETTVGWGLPVVAGETSSPRGSVRAVMVDDTADAEKFIVSQGGIFTVNKVVRKRADAFTTLTKGAGNDYTVIKYAKDGEDNFYAYVQLTAGKWAEGDELYVDLEAPPKTGYGTFDGSNDYGKRTAALTPNLPGRSGHTGNFTGEVKIRPGSIGVTSDDYALNLDGTSELAYTTDTTEAWLQSGVDLYIQFEVMPDGGSSSDETIVMQGHHNQGGAQGFEVSMDSSDKANWSVDGGGIITAANALSLVNRTRVTCAYNHTTKAAYIHYDGVLQADVVWGSGDPYVAAKRCSIAAAWNNAESAWWRHFGGQLGHVRILEGTTYTDGRNLTAAAANHAYEFEEDLTDSGSDSKDLTGVNIAAGDYEKIASASTNQTIEGIWDEGNNKRSWRLHLIGTTGKLRLYLSGDGTAEYYAEGGTALTQDAGVTIRYGFYTDAAPFIQLDGTAESLTTSGTRPTALYASDADFELGSDEGGSNLFNGQIKNRVLIADGAQPVASGCTDDSDSPLEDITGEWPMFYCYTDSGTEYQQDVVSGYDLELAGLAAGDYTLSTQETNPAWLADRWLRWSWYWGLDSSLIDRSSFAIAAALCTTNGWDTAGDFGFISPDQPGTSLDNERDQWALFAEFCRSFGHCPIITADGKIALKRFDITEFASGAVPEYYEKHGDIAPPGLKIDLRPFKLINDVKALWKHTHHDYEATRYAHDANSEATFGVTLQDVWRYRGIRNADMLEDIVERDLLLVSGKVKLVEFTVPTMAGLQADSDIGDIIEVTPIKRPFSWEGQQLLIADSIPSPAANNVVIRAYTIGDHLGGIAFQDNEAGGGGGEGEEALIASKSAFIGVNQQACGSNKFTDADIDANYSSQDYLRHGHHYVNANEQLCTNETAKGFSDWPAYSAWYASVLGVPACKWWNTGYGNINWRLLLRYDLDGWSGRTISSVSIRLHVLQVPSFLQGYTDMHVIGINIYTPPEKFGVEGVKDNTQTDRAGWSGGGVYEYDGDAWVEGTVTWRDITWSAGTQYGDISSGAGTKIVTLNAAGIDAFQAAADADETIDLTLQGFSEGNTTQAVKIASTRHADETKRPAAIMVWT